MKNILCYTILFGLLQTTVSCQKDISDRTANLPALLINNSDTMAGSWKPVLLSRPDSFTVAAPVPTSSPLYVADLNEIKDLGRYH